MLLDNCYIKNYYKNALPFPIKYWSGINAKITVVKKYKTYVESALSHLSIGNRVNAILNMFLEY
jgi:hypothetical protein